MIATDIEKMVAVGLVWGATNAFIRRGALLWDQRPAKISSPSSSNPPDLRRRFISSLKNLLSLLLFWQYSVPFLLNLSASATFFALLSDAPISLAVPVTNATTFAATAVFGMLLGEKIRFGFALLGTGFIVAGSCSESAVCCYERCIAPINLILASSSCPLISIP